MEWLAVILQFVEHRRARGRADCKTKHEAVAIPNAATHWSRT